jgi:3'-phosphoadenosine 5'-phosphosulfate sulfotransferase (PAPS reductase)/FAD synthetase
VGQGEVKSEINQMLQRVLDQKGRIVCQFSCGAASAVATKLIIAEYGHKDVAIVNAFIQEEHPDNRRFLTDCEKWFEHPVTVLRNEKYGASTHKIWRRKRYIIGHHRAPCSVELKRNLLDDFSRPKDVMVLGYTVEEQDRYDRFIDANNDRHVLVPLIRKNLTKADCLAMIERAGIALPEMYRLGFNNANCIGCPKGGAGYWNKIRKVFPEQFSQIADIQEMIGPGAKFMRNRRTGERIYLRELDPTHGRIEDEPEITCSFHCELAEREIYETANLEKGS